MYLRYWVLRFMKITGYAWADPAHLERTTILNRSMMTTILGKNTHKIIRFYN